MEWNHFSNFGEGAQQLRWANKKISSISSAEIFTQHAKHWFIARLSYIPKGPDQIFNKSAL